MVLYILLVYRLVLGVNNIRAASWLRSIFLLVLILFYRQLFILLLNCINYCSVTLHLIMESIIYSFINNYLLLKLFVYVRQEGPKGELGLIICTNNINKLYRLKIRSPD